MIENTAEQLVVEPTALRAAADVRSAQGLGMPARRLLPVQRLFQGRRGPVPRAVGKQPVTHWNCLPKNPANLGGIGFWHGDSAFDAKLWRNVLNIEIGNRSSRTVISSDGVVSEASVLRPRALKAKGVNCWSDRFGSRALRRQEHTEGRSPSGCPALVSLMPFAAARELACKQLRRRAIEPSASGGVIGDM